MFLGARATYVYIYILYRVNPVWILVEFLIHSHYKLSTERGVPAPTRGGERSPFCLEFDLVPHTLTLLLPLVNHLGAVNTSLQSSYRPGLAADGFCARVNLQLSVWCFGW